MEVTSTPPPDAFGAESARAAADTVFPGASEMARRCRAFDWSTTPLGPVERWPQSLRTAAGMVVGHAFASIVLWGPELIQIYNDGYIAVHGAKHPWGLGRPTREVWPEVWHLNGPLFARARAGETVALHDAPYALARRGPDAPPDDVFVSLSFSPIPDEAGGVGGVLVTLVDTTAEVRSRELLAERERLLAAAAASAARSRQLLDAAPAVIALYSGPELVLRYVNPVFEQSMGRANALGQRLRDIFPEIERTDLGEALERAQRTGEPYTAPERHVPVRRADGVLEDRYWDLVAQPLPNLDGSGEHDLLVHAVEVTAQVRARAALAESEARYRALFEQSPLGVIVYDADGRPAAANPAAARLWGASVGDAPAGYSVWDDPQLEESGALDVFRRAFAGESGTMPPARYDMTRTAAGGRGRAVWVETHFFPVHDGTAGAGDGAPGPVRQVVVTQLDVTARVEAEADRARLLADAEAERERLDAVLAQLPLGVVITEAPSGRVVAVNDAVARIWGQRPRTDAVERYSTEWVGYHADGRRVANEEWPVARALLQGEVVNDETYEIERADGTRALIEVSAAPVRDAAGRVTAAVAVLDDVSARAQAERERERLVRALEVERARLADIFRQAPTFLAVARGPTYVFELVNDAYYQLVGHRELLGKGLLDAIPEVRGAGFVELLDEVLATGSPFVGRELPVTLARTPGAPPEERFLDLVYQPLVEGDGTRSGVIAHGTDVTEQVLARREVERLLGESERSRGELAAANAELEARTAAAVAAEQQQAAVLASIADAFYLLDREWRFTYVNAAAEPLLRTTREALLGRSLWEAFPGVIGSVFEGPYREAMATGRPTSAEAYFEPLRTWFDVRSYPWTGGLMVHFRDIGARKEAERERERLLADAEAARAEAEAANRAKSEFLAVMSHELRTPLNAIGGYAELMEMGIRGPVTAQQREDLARIQNSQRHLLGLINEVLNYAKLETGTVRFDLEDVRVQDALGEAEGLVAPQVRAKGLDLAVDACDGGLLVRADPEKLRQILVNLLSNAVKFTDRGGRIALHCEARPGQVALRVRDTGIGIPADKLEAIFEPFVQVRADLTRTAEGTGLGLAISRDLARGMGGELTVESAEGAGSTFTVTLPRA